MASPQAGATSASRASAQATDDVEAGRSAEDPIRAEDAVGRDLDGRLFVEALVDADAEPPVACNAAEDSLPPHCVGPSLEIDWQVEENIDLVASRDPTLKVLEGEIQGDLFTVTAVVEG